MKKNEENISRVIKNLTESFKTDMMNTSQHIAIAMESVALILLIVVIIKERKNLW